MRMRTHRPQTLRKALTWLLLGALVPLLLGSSALLWRQWHSQRAASLNRLSDVALALQLSVDRELALHQTALQVLATSVAIDNRDWPAFYAAAEAAASVRPGTWVLLGDWSGQTLVNTLVPFGTPLPNFLSMLEPDGEQMDWDGRSLPWFDRGVLSGPLTSGRTRIGDLFYGPVANGPVLALSVPVKRQGKVRYSLAFAYPPESFVKFLQQQPQHDEMFMGIVDSHGLYIAVNRGAERTIAHKVAAPFDRGNSLPPQGIIEGVMLEDVPAFFAHRRSDLADWTVIVGMPRDQVLGPVRASLWLWLVLVLAMLLLAVILAHRFWRGVALPLIDLARQAREPGETSIDIPPSRIDEVETLRRALQDSAEAQRARREEIARRLAVEEREHLIALQHAEDLRAADVRKDEFLAMLGHELRNPMAALGNSLALVRRLAAEDPSRQALQAMMERQARQLSRLVDDLLDVSRINTGKIVLRMERVDLSTLVRQAGQAAQPVMEQRGHAFAVTVPSEPVWVDGDEVRLAQITGNLLDNAAKYTAPGGKVELHLGLENGSAVLSVTDSGKGIPPDLLPHVFDLFTQGERHENGGLGIGLHIVKRLVEKHAGRINVSSGGAQRGSVFEVRLPLAQGPAQPGAELQQAPAQALRLLVVDDNRDASDSLARLLQLDGHAVQVAYDGRQALELACKDPPDAVLLDIAMPGMDGYELARRLREEPATRNAFLIALTGYGKLPDLPGKRSDFDLHLTKPVEGEQLRRALASAARTRAQPSASET